MFVSEEMSRWFYECKIVEIFVTSLLIYCFNSHTHTYAYTRLHNNDLKRFCPLHTAMTPKPGGYILPKSNIKQSLQCRSCIALCCCKSAETDKSSEHRVIQICTNEPQTNTENNKTKSV